MMRRPPRSTRTDTPFPSTPRFRSTGAVLLDMKAASESLVVAYRGRVLAALAVAAVLLALTVWIAMRMSVLAHRRAVHVGADAASPPRIGVAREKIGRAHV